MSSRRRVEHEAARARELRSRSFMSVGLLCRLGHMWSRGLRTRALMPPSTSTVTVAGCSKALLVMRYCAPHAHHHRRRSSQKSRSRPPRSLFIPLAFAHRRAANGRAAQRRGCERLAARAAARQRPQSRWSRRASRASAICWFTPAARVGGGHPASASSARPGAFTATFSDRSSAPVI